MIDSLFKYYLAHQDKLVERYNGKYLVITQDGVKGAFDTDADGYELAVKTFGLGNFLLQPMPSACQQSYLMDHLNNNE